jgi:hypothetical protein
VLVDEPQAFALAGRQQADGILSDDVSCDHDASS